MNGRHANKPSDGLFTDKDVKIMRLQSDLRLANQAREDAANEVIIGMKNGYIPCLF